MIGLLFSGQGSQATEMGRDLYEKYPKVRDFYDGLNLDFDLKKISFETDLETLSKTTYTQPALVAFHLAILRVLKSKGLDYGAVAGLSLGEYSALVAAGVLKEEEAMEIIENRAKYMASCCQANPSTMLALISKDETRIYQAIKELDQEGFFVEIANLNCPGQVVIGIKKDEKPRIMEKLEQVKGLRLTELAVEGAFHTSLMEEAEKKLALDLDQVDFKSPLKAVYLNRTGKILEEEDLGQLMAEQASHTTYFEKSLKAMIDDGVKVFLEIGNNDIFKGFMKRIDKDIRVIGINSVESIENLEVALNEQ